MRPVLILALVIGSVIATMAVRRATEEGYDRGWHDGVKAAIAEMEKQAGIATGH